MNRVSDSNFARAWSHAFSQQDVDERMQKYEHNLRLVLSLAAERTIPTIIGTVSSNLLQPYLPEQDAARYPPVYERWKTGETEEGLELANQILASTVGRHQSSSQENDIIRKLASELSVPLVDVVAMVAKAEPHGIPGETMFDDHCHLNRAGREVWIEGFKPQVREAIKKAHEQTGDSATN